MFLRIKLLRKFKNSESETKRLMDSKSLKLEESSRSSKEQIPVATSYLKGEEIKESWKTSIKKMKEIADKENVDEDVSKIVDDPIDAFTNDLLTAWSKR